MEKGYKLYECPEGADPILLAEGKIDVISAKVEELKTAAESGAAGGQTTE